LLITTGESFSTTEGAVDVAIGTFDVSTLLTASATGVATLVFADVDLEDVGMVIPALLLDLSYFLLVISHTSSKIQQGLTITTFCVTFARQHNLGEEMKSILTVAAFVAFATTATAGSLADPVIELPIVVQDASSSSSGTTTVALLALLLMIPVLD
jgi:hypothetical protein